MSSPGPPVQSSTRTSGALGFWPIDVIQKRVGQLDPDRARALGARWGRRASFMGGAVTDLSRINLQLAFPEESVAFRQNVLEQSFQNLGMGVAELALLQGPHREHVLDGVHLEGEENLARPGGGPSERGALIVTAHFGTWDLYAAAIARRYPLTVIHRGFKNERITEMMTRVRHAGGGDLEEVRMGPRAVTGLLGALRRGRYCILLMDQNARREEGVFTPFFSRLACTRSAPAVVAMRRGVPVYPVFGHREGRSGRHRVCIGSPLAMESVTPEDGIEAFESALNRNVGRMTSAIEEAISHHPDQWVWSQRRWKTRPDAPEAEATSLYPSRSGWGRSLRRRWRSMR